MLAQHESRIPAWSSRNAPRPGPRRCNGRTWAIRRDTMRLSLGTTDPIWRPLIRRTVGVAATRWLNALTSRAPVGPAPHEAGE